MNNTLKENDKAPGFTLTETNGQEITLSSYIGQNVILFFYPKDNTPGCTKEACSFRDDINLFKDKNSIIIGISKDDLDSHGNFIKKYNLPFLLLSDSQLSVSKMYGVWKEKVNFGKKYMGIERSTFIIDDKGFIKKIFRRVRVDGHSAKCLESI